MIKCLKYFFLLRTCLQSLTYLRESPEGVGDFIRSEEPVSSHGGILITSTTKGLGIVRENFVSLFNYNYKLILVVITYIDL